MLWATQVKLVFFLRPIPAVFASTPIDVDVGAGNSIPSPPTLLLQGSCMALLSLRCLQTRQATTFRTEEIEKHRYRFVKVLHLFYNCVAMVYGIG